jgi:chemotaxis protein MotB
METPEEEAVEEPQQTSEPSTSQAGLFSGLKKNISDHRAIDDGAESWVITYIDVITLLLSMFVLLLALSSQNKKGYEELQDSLKGAVTKPAEEKEQSEKENIQRKMVEFSARLKQKDLAQELSYHFEEGKLVVQLGEKILFPSAEASLNTSGYTVLEQILPVLNDTHYAIVIEGHTDNVPISNQQYASNWELSAARAANVVRYLSGHGIEPGRLSAVGFADTKPIEDNTTAAGRAKNRRVTFKISYEQ